MDLTSAVPLADRAARIDVNTAVNNRLSSTFPSKRKLLLNAANGRNTSNDPELGQDKKICVYDSRLAAEATYEEKDEEKQKERDEKIDESRTEAQQLNAESCISKCLLAAETDVLGILFAQFINNKSSQI